MSIDTYDIYQIRGDKNAERLFKFLTSYITRHGDSSPVEFGWATTGIEGDSGLNFISTSHEISKKISLPPRYDTSKNKWDKYTRYIDKEPSLPHLLGHQLLYDKTGKGQYYTIRVITHSHPFTKKASQDDTLNKIGVLNIWGNNRDTIKFRIYYPFTKDSGVFNNY